MNPVIILTCKQLNLENPDKSGWVLAKKWQPEPGFLHDYDPYYRRYFMVPIEQPIKVPLGTKEDGYYYYTENWVRYEERDLKMPLFEIHETKDRSQITVSHLRVVRGSTMTTVWQEIYYRGPYRDLPPRLRNAEQIHFARLRKEAAE